IGVDEAGRGPWAGPVVASAFCFDPENMPSKDIIKQVGDSKQLSSKKREALYPILIHHGIFGVGVVDNYLIDTINIRQANREAMRRAILELMQKLGLPKKKCSYEILIDGRDNYHFEGLDTQPSYIVGGDGKVLEIGAASIIAKVFRDKMMTAYGSLYPDFGFETNAGYGTKKHQAALKSSRHITGIHRQSYAPIRKLLS
ncbi:ribonuclease HII, partial [Candidatus Gracilibacteria bacterium]|nr:ribonuclease HII [Candidatus Gracilibacteria bacterium]